MTDTARRVCPVHGEVDERVTPGGRTGAWTCPTMVRRTVGEFDVYGACGEPLAAMVAEETPSR